MPVFSQNSPLLLGSNHKLTKWQLHRGRVQHMLWARLSGKSYEECGKLDYHGDIMTEKSWSTPEEVQKILRHLIHDVMWKAYTRWQIAEIRCHALAMEVRLLRLHGTAPPDQTLDEWGMPPVYLRAFKAVRIDTLYKLRSVDSEMLMANWRFPKAAIAWAIMKLDHEGLSHSLSMQRKNLTWKKIPKKLV